MTVKQQLSAETIETVYQRLSKEATASGYNLNPDREHTKLLVEGLLTNEQRYGYWACPCRLAEGEKKEDLDIICPCDYRDADLNEYDTCYCGLYVSNDIKEGKKELISIPERRPERSDRLQQKKQKGETSLKGTYPVWRCRVCGYLCARDGPPGVCPICKAKKERFEQFQ